MKRETGNALLLILIAVALFAALSYAVTNSGRSGGSIDKEQIKLNVAQFVQYANLIETSFNRLKLRGCQTSEISFQSDAANSPSTYTNPSSPPDNSCHIFHQNGGGVHFAPEIIDRFFGRTITSSNAIQGVGSTMPELLIRIDLYPTSPFPVVDAEEFCIEVNRAYGLNLSSIPTDTDVNYNPEFDGTMLSSATRIIGDEAGGTDLVGQRAACFLETSSGNHLFYLVLEQQ